MGNTQCECISTHHNEKLLQIYHPTIQQNHHTKTKHPLNNSKPYFELFHCSNIDRQKTQPLNNQSQSKVSVYHLDESSVELHEKDYNHLGGNQNHLGEGKNHLEEKQNFLGLKQNHINKSNIKKQSSLYPIITNRRSNSKLNRSHIKETLNTQHTQKKPTLRQRVNKDTQKVKQNPSLKEINSPKINLPSLQLQTDYSFIESLIDADKQPGFKILSFQKGVTLREQYEFKRMIEKNMVNHKDKLKLWPQLNHQQSYFAHQLKFYYNSDLFNTKKTQKQHIYKIVLEKISSQSNKSQESIQKITKFYRGNIKTTNPQDQSGKPTFSLEGLGQQYSITNDNYNQFTYFNGDYKDNQFQGNGLFVHADLDYYVGDWKNSKAHGHGTFQHYEGMWYQGSWKNDQQHGQGQQLWQDGAIFRGKFFHGYKIYGQFQWPNNTSYLGQFNQNRLQGKGKFTYQDNRSYYGEWKDNMMHGYGQFKWKNGQIYKGNYEFDKKHGNGTLILGDGIMIEAKWVEGKIHGKGKVTKKNGQVRIIEWDMGVEIKPNPNSKR